MSQILFGQSYFLRFDPKLWQAMQPYPPLGTLYAASYLREHGYDVAVFDAMLAESETEWGQALAAHQPDFAVLYEDNFNYLSKMCLLRMREAGLRDDPAGQAARLRRSFYAARMRPTMPKITLAAEPILSCLAKAR